MKIAVMMTAMAALLMGCAASDAKEIEAIEVEMERSEAGSLQYVDISIETISGTRYYIVASRMVVTEDNFFDFMLVHAQMVGVMHRAIASDAGVFSFGTATFWLDLPMNRVHEIYRANEQGRNDDVFDMLDRYSTFYDEHPARR